MPVAIEGFLIDAMGKPLHGYEIELKARHTSATVLAQTIARQQVRTDGFYSLSVEVGCYDVFLHSPGYRPVLVGRINVYGDSTSGTLNDFLMAMSADDLTPDIVRRFERMVAQAESAAQSAVESKSEAAKFAQTAEAYATQATNAQREVVSSAEQVRHDVEVVAKDKQLVELIAVDVQNQSASAIRSASQALDAQTVVSKLAEEVSENASLVFSSAAQVEENTKAVRELVNDVAQKRAEVVEKTDAALNAAGEAERCATEAGVYRSSALDAAERAKKAVLEAEHVVVGAMQADNSLSEIAALGEEAKHNTRQNLGMGNAAVMNVQQDIYDRIAGCVALPGAFGYGSRIETKQKFSATNGVAEFYDWVKNARQGRYCVTQYGGSGHIDIINGVVFNGIVEIIYPDQRYRDNEIPNEGKLILFYGVNGDVYFNRYSPNLAKLTGWEKWKLKVDDLTNALRSGDGGTDWRNPGVGGLVLALYRGMGDGDKNITLNRLESVQGSRLSLIDINLTRSGELTVFAEESKTSPLPGLYQALSGYGSAPSNTGCISLFMRIA